MPKRALTAPLAAVLVAWAVTGFAAERFFSGIADLPVMPGLEQVPGAGVSFDKPAGRIVEVAASGPKSRREIIEFYDAVLPQLGWRAAGKGRYRREGEHLNLSISKSGPKLTVRFSLRPD